MLEAWCRYTSTAVASQSTGRVRIGASALGGVVATAQDFGNAATARNGVICNVRAQVTIQTIGTAGFAVAQIIETRPLASTVITVSSGAAVAINTTTPMVIALTDISGLAGATKTYDICRIAVVR